MKRSLRELEATRFDVAIIGGGITGACLAFDATLRGMSAALVEKGDFGGATSAASSKLLHGGIRYLQQGNFRKVRESAIERVYFQRLAPHLTHYVPFVIPAYSGLQKGRALLAAGLAAYEALCAGQNRWITDPAKKVPRGRLLDRANVRQLVPGPLVDEMTGGILLYESHMHSSERMTLSFVKTASMLGATVANYMRADSFLTCRNRVIGFRATDMLDGREIGVRAAVVVNAAGPWIPLLNSAVGDKGAEKVVTGFSKGAHIVTSALTNGHAIALATREKNEALLNRGGRHIFVIPWRNHSIIGTTYGSYAEDLDRVGPSEVDVSELLGRINGALGEEFVQRDDVVSAYAGLYPLVDECIDPGKYQGTGKYQVVDHSATDGLEGLVSVFGAKYTTARRLAEKAGDLIANKLSGEFRLCGTRGAVLTGGAIENIEQYRRDKVQEYASVVPPEIAEELISNYGTEADRIIDLAKSTPALASRLSPRSTVLAAEVVYAARGEMVGCLEDFVFRRTGLGTLGNPGADALKRCAQLLGAELGWDEQRLSREVHDVVTKFVFGTAAKS